MRGGALVFILGESMKFTVKEEKSNHSGSLPAHFNILDQTGEYEVSVWTTHKLAQDIAYVMEYLPECIEHINYLKRPGLIGGRHGC